MKHRVRLLKLWKDAEGKEYQPGTVLEVDAKTAGELLLDGTAEKDVTKTVDTADVTKSIGDAVKVAITDSMKDLPSNTAKAIHSIQVKDLSDEDPFHGFLPGYNGTQAEAKNLPKERKNLALGLFCKEIFDAGPEMAKPSERLRKSLERGKEMIRKAAGTGLTVAADDSAGALLVPAVSDMLMDMRAEASIFRGRCPAINLSTMSIRLPKVKDYDRSSNLVYGGMLAYWKGENAEYTASQWKVEEIGLNLHKLTAMAYASDEIMRFAPIDIGAYTAQGMVAAVTFKENSAFIAGTGAGMPLGLLNAPCKIAISGESGQTTDTIVLKNLYKMEMALRVQNAAGVRWFYNRLSSLVDLRTLFLAMGTGGSQVPLFQGNPFSDEATLDGIPISHTEHAPVIGDAGCLVLTDLSQYLVADDRMGPELAQSIHLKFDYGQTCWRLTTYTDGQPVNSTYFTDAKSKTSSSVVTLAAI